MLKIPVLKKNTDVQNIIAGDVQRAIDQNKILDLCQIKKKGADVCDVCIISPDPSRDRLDPLRYAQYSFLKLKNDPKKQIESVLLIRWLINQHLESSTGKAVLKGFVQKHLATQLKEHYSFAHWVRVNQDVYSFFTQIDQSFNIVPYPNNDAVLHFSRSFQDRVVHGVDVNSIDKRVERKCFLEAATLEGNLAAVDWLITHGADINHKSLEANLLLLAIRNRKPDLVRFYLVKIFFGDVNREEVLGELFSQLADGLSSELHAVVNILEEQGDIQDYNDLLSKFLKFLSDRNKEPCKEIILFFLKKITERHGVWVLNWASLKFFLSSKAVFDVALNDCLFSRTDINIVSDTDEASPDVLDFVEHFMRVCKGKEKEVRVSVKIDYVTLKMKKMWLQVFDKPVKFILDLRAVRFGFDVDCKREEILCDNKKLVHDWKSEGAHSGGYIIKLASPCDQNILKEVVADLKKEVASQKKVALSEFLEGLVRLLNEELKESHDKNIETLKHYPLFSKWVSADLEKNKACLLVFAVVARGGMGDLLFKLIGLRELQLQGPHPSFVCEAWHAVISSPLSGGEKKKLLSALLQGPSYEPSRAVSFQQMICLEMSCRSFLFEAFKEMRQYDLFDSFCAVVFKDQKIPENVVRLVAEEYFKQKILINSVQSIDGQMSGFLAASARQAAIRRVPVGQVISKQSNLEKGVAFVETKQITRKLESLRKAASVFREEEPVVTPEKKQEQAPGKAQKEAPEGVSLLHDFIKPVALVQENFAGLEAALNILAGNSSANNLSFLVESCLALGIRLLETQGASEKKRLIFLDQLYILRGINLFFSGKAFDEVVEEKEFLEGIKAAVRVMFDTKDPEMVLKIEGSLLYLPDFLINLHQESIEPKKVANSFILTILPFCTPLESYEETRDFCVAYPDDYLGLVSKLSLLKYPQLKAVLDRLLPAIQQQNWYSVCEIFLSLVSLENKTDRLALKGTIISGFAAFITWKKRSSNPGTLYQFTKELLEAFMLLAKGDADFSELTVYKTTSQLLEALNSDSIKDILKDGKIDSVEFLRVANVVSKIELGAKNYLRSHMASLLAMLSIFLDISEEKPWLGHFHSAVDVVKSISTYEGYEEIHDASILIQLLVDAYCQKEPRPKEIGQHVSLCLSVLSGCERDQLKNQKVREWVSLLVSLMKAKKFTEEVFVMAKKTYRIAAALDNFFNGSWFGDHEKDLPGFQAVLGDLKVKRLGNAETLWGLARSSKLQEVLKSTSSTVSSVAGSLSGALPVLNTILQVMNLGATIYFGVKILKKLDGVNKNIGQLREDVRVGILSIKSDLSGIDRRLQEITGQLQVIDQELNKTRTCILESVRELQVNLTRTIQGESSRVINFVDRLEEHAVDDQMAAIFYSISDACAKPNLDLQTFSDCSKMLFKCFSRDPRALVSIYNQRHRLLRDPRNKDVTYVEISDSIELSTRLACFMPDQVYPNVRLWFLYVFLYKQLLMKAGASGLQLLLENEVCASRLLSILEAAETIKRGLLQLTTKNFLVELDSQEVNPKEVSKKVLWDAHACLSGIPSCFKILEDIGFSTGQDANRKKFLEFIGGVLEAHVLHGSYFDLIDRFLVSLVHTLGEVLSEEHYRGLQQQKIPGLTSFFKINDSCYHGPALFASSKRQLHLSSGMPRVILDQSTQVSDADLLQVRSAQAGCYF